MSKLVNPRGGKTTNWRAGCGRSARPVRREGESQALPTPIKLLQQIFRFSLYSAVMKTTLLASGLTALLAAATAFAAPPTYKVVNKIKIGGATRWDYVYLDSENHRLYVSHATQTEVIDTTTDKLVGTIPDTKGVHGIAIANDLGKGFTSDGADNDVTMFDIKTLKVLGKIKTGQNPDSIIYEPVTHRVFTFNGRSSDSTSIDAKTGDVLAASIPVGGKPEFAQVDGKGHIYVNIEEKNEIIEVDAKNNVVADRKSTRLNSSHLGI